MHIVFQSESAMSCSQSTLLIAGHHCQHDYIVLTTEITRPKVLYNVLIRKNHKLQPVSIVNSWSPLPAWLSHTGELDGFCCGWLAEANAPQVCNTDDKVQQLVSNGSTLVLADARHCKSCAAASQQLILTDTRHCKSGAANQQWQHIDPHRYETLQIMCCS